VCVCVCCVDFLFIASLSGLLIYLSHLFIFHNAPDANLMCLFVFVCVCVDSI